MTDDVAITSTDCTPRESDARGVAEAERVLRGLRTEAHHDNRMAALRTSADGLHFTRCACGWIGLRVSDPEVARREYDVHACRMTGEIGRTSRRVGEPLGADWVAETKAMLAARAAELEAPVEQQRDEFEARVQQLEMK